ncbi:PRP4 pre-mRNA processing factor 4 [Musa troglodytarum]|uniref:PRP4 pre-mRNA processing factor 4 n=1 Tax=Musa troglodytarum TaxID=320322 RepID=A0A9E7FDS5_9LILI|nr:PRP4 pre-mRNA processing factor 4 [Musa troglodytarum]
MSSPCPGRKRRRDEGEEESTRMSSPEAKRLLLDILDDDADAGDQDVTSVMKSLEEEIALPSPPPPPHVPPQDAAVSDLPDLGYLFEASDDELGLPPPAPSSSGDGSEACNEEEGVGFAQIWGFDEDLSGYNGFELGIRPEAEDVVVFDGELFDYGDATVCGAPEFADLSWRSETLPAV